MPEKVGSLSFQTRNSKSLEISSSANGLRGIDRLLHSRKYEELINLICKYSKVITAHQVSTYHLKHPESTQQFSTGDVVGLDLHSRLISDNLISTNVPHTFLVVNESQNGLISSKSSRGHWCTGIGIAHVRVDELVNAGQIIACKINGKGCCQVARTHSIIPLGFALESTIASLSPKKQSLIRVLVSQDPALLSSLPQQPVSQQQYFWLVWKMLERSITTLAGGIAEAQELLECLRVDVIRNFIEDSEFNTVAQTSNLQSIPGSTAEIKSKCMFFSFGLPFAARNGSIEFQKRTIARAGSIDRCDALDYLKSHTSSKGTLVSVHGHAGTGKSFLLSTLIFQLQQNFRSGPVIWLDASSSTSLCKGFVFLAQKILSIGSQNQPPQTKTIGALETVNSWLVRTEGWVLVLDNVKECACIDLLKLPFEAGTVLITTRMPTESFKKFLKGGPIVQHNIVLGVFEPNEAVSYLRRSVGCADSESAVLSKKLEYVPITLGLVTAYLRDRKLKISQLIADFERRQSQQSHLPATGEEKAVLPPFLQEIVYGQVAGLKTSNPAACYCIVICSFLYSTGIQVPSTEPFSWSSISRLIQLSLLSDGEYATFDMHELIQIAVLCWLKSGPDAISSCGFPFYSALTFAYVPGGMNIDPFRLSYTDCLRRAEDIVKVQMQAQNATAMSSAAPHLLNLIQNGSQDLEIITVAANYLQDVQRDCEKSLELRNLLLKVQATAFNVEQRAETLFSIAQIYEIQDKPNEAISTCEEVLKVLQPVTVNGTSLPPPQSVINVIKALEAIGFLCMKLGRFKSAQLRFEESLSFKERQYGQGSPDLIPTLQNLARACYLQGYYDLALEKLQHTLGLMRCLRGNHLEVSKLLSTIGLVFTDLQRYEEAFASYEEALKLAENVGSSANAHNAILHLSYGNVFEAVGRYPEAISQHMEALRLQRLVCGGADDLFVVRILDALARTHSVRGQHAESVELSMESLALKKRLFASKPLYVADCEMSLATQLRLLSRRPQAVAACKAALAVYERELGSGHAKVAGARNLLEQMQDPDICTPRLHRGYSNSAIELLRCSIKDIVLLPTGFGVSKPPSPRQLAAAADHADLSTEGGAPAADRCSEDLVVPTLQILES